MLSYFFKQVSKFIHGVHFISVHLDEGKRLKMNTREQRSKHGLEKTLFLKVNKILHIVRYLQDES